MPGLGLTSSDFSPSSPDKSYLVAVWSLAPAVLASEHGTIEGAPYSMRQAFLFATRILFVAETSKMPQEKPLFAQTN